MKLNEQIRRILREENFIPLEDLTTVIKDYEDGFDVFIMNKDEKIGEISFAKESLPNVYTIVDATIDDEYKGNRIYAKTIINLFKERPNIIINSLFRSPEANKAWIYILNNLPPNIGKSVKYYKDEDTTLFQLKLKNLQEQIRKVLRETLESKWNKGNYDYQYGYCHYFAYNVIGKIRKMFPKKKVNYYLLLAQEIDNEDRTIVQDYLVHVYIKIDNMLLDSNGITTMDEAWKRLEEWEERQRHLVPDEYRTEIFDEETNEIPEYFFNNTFCNTGRVKKDMEEFLNNPIVKRILRDK